MNSGLILLLAEEACRSAAGVGRRQAESVSKTSAHAENNWLVSRIPAKVHPQLRRVPRLVPALYASITGISRCESYRSIDQETLYASEEALWV